MPVKSENLGYPLGYATTLFSWCWGMSSFFLFVYYGWTGLAIMLLWFHATHAIDYLTSNATQLNLEKFEKNGVSKSEVLKMYLINSVWWWTGNIAVLYFIKDDVEPYFSFRLIAKVIISLALTDIAFWAMHRLMHQTLPDMHKNHHCVKYPSLTSNLMFDPTDLAIEFSLPSVVATVCHTYVEYDAFCLCLTMCIMVTWYSSDHDEYLKLPHWYHHHYINSFYAVYSPWGKYDPKDQVRKMVK